VKGKGSGCGNSSKGKRYARLSIEERTRKKGKRDKKKRRCETTLGSRDKVRGKKRRSRLLPRGPSERCEGCITRTQGENEMGKKGVPLQGGKLAAENKKKD